MSKINHNLEENRDNQRFSACKRKEEQQVQSNQPPAPKKPRLVFTDIQRRTLQAIFKETKRPSRDMQQTISQQLNLDPTTVANFFMNARRRGHDLKSDEEEANKIDSVSAVFDDLEEEGILEPEPVHQNPSIFEQL
ncbi:unnamed protein product [Caenorhabditis auriculariae]|uniref:Homeobox domain-containing protein n=1 Tax=Caenorhabditis auriculariae TaxID=2777116 RepID=A0A8S1HUH2_9PELO|nr:unnamed protein product [Caenorhabditis auriculariae]